MNAQVIASPAIPRIGLLDRPPAGVATVPTPALPLSGNAGADARALARGSSLMDAAMSARPVAPVAATPAVQADGMSVAGVSSLFHGAAARHVALATRPGGNAGAVTQRFIDTMSAAAVVERGEGKGAPDAGASAASSTGAKAGISSLFGKISTMHADLEKRFVDPASYTSAAGMIGLQRMTGMYSIYFETLSKSVLKVVRDADTFMKSSA